MLALALVAKVPMHFTSFEAYPMAAEDIARALNAFPPEARAIAELFLDAWTKGERRFRLGWLEVEVVEGDARQTLPAWEGAADAWFLDGFSPAKNPPELWGGDNLMRTVGEHTAAHGTCATYTAAGFVRRALSDAGFEVTRIPGYGRKRHMTAGVKR